MSAIFLKVLNMSITASWLILAVVLTRLILKKAPKWIPCLLWGLVAIRLICPFSFESVLSLIPSSETIPANIAQQHEPAITSGITIVNEVVNPVISRSFTPAPTESANPLQIVIPVAAIIWIAGIVIMLAYALISYLKLKKSVSVCVPVKEGILSCDEVKAPFILGVFRPVIYVPSSMHGETLYHVIRHETAHLERHDHWWKPLGFLLLSVYWFNPLCWIAYILLCRDIEMACDEKVIRDMDRDDMAAYSQALLDCSFPRRRIAACPLAFGEVGVKERVKGVLNYKKPAFWIVLIAVLACVCLAVCLLTDPSSGRTISFGNIQLSWVKALDLRPNEPTTRDLTRDELEELKSRLAALKIGKRDDELGGFTPYYSLSAYSSQTGQFMIASFDYEGNHIGIMYQNHYYRIHDDGFSDYLSKVCAGISTVDMTDNGKRNITLDDVRRLAQKGAALSWDDFDTYQGMDIGSGLYIMQYVIDDVFDVLVGGASPEEEPWYIHLRNRDINAWVDIRTDDVNGFLAEYASDSIHDFTKSGKYEYAIPQAYEGGPSLQVFKTNSERIQVKNDSDTDIICYLYDVQYDEPIAEATIKARDKAVFTNLTASRQYQIGIKPVGVEIQITVSD